MDYQQILTHIENSPKIFISNEERSNVMDFVRKFKSAKRQEKNHRIDDDQQFQRFLNGFLGEYALEKFLGVQFRDDTVGQSSKYNQSDLKSIGIQSGVKTFRKGNYPTVLRQFNGYQILVCTESVFNDNKEPIGTYAYICGLAHKDVLDKYSSVDLISNKKLKERNVKAGFYGFDHLVPFHNIEELKKELNSMIEQHKEMKKQRWLNSQKI